MDNCLFTSFYKNCYKDIENLSDKEVKRHWNKIGIKEGRLPNKIIFDQKFPNFDYKSWIKINNKYKFSNKYEIYGWVFLNNKEMYKKYLVSNGYILKENSSDNFNKIESNLVSNDMSEINKDLSNLIITNNIKKIWISNALKHFEERILKKYNLELYDKINDIKSSTLFFGLYDKYDFERIVKHYGKKFLMWGGTDCDDRYKIRKNSIFVIKKVSNLIHIAISESIHNRLNKYSIENQLVNFNLVDKNLFKPVDNTGDCIYIYNGFTKGNEYIYGESIYKQVVEKLKFEIIYSNELNVSWEIMPSIYSKCFIGLRLTEQDGNANTVQEFNSMNIPIIFNGPGGIKWENTEDIIKNIKKIYYNKHKKNFDITEINNIMNEPFKYDFSLTNHYNTNLELVYKNIDSFINLIKNFTNILFICSDQPGYGGAATNCSKIENFISSYGHNSFSIYYSFDESLNECINENNMIFTTRSKLYNELNNLSYQPDLIILKSFVDFDLKEIFICPVFYLIPGIYTNELNINYKNLNTKNKNDEYINASVLKQINLADYSFSNSYHTHKILNDIYNINTLLFYSTFVSFYNKKINIDDEFENRKYNFALIISNFNREIKNAVKSLEYLENKLNVLLIGENIPNKYKNFSNFKCIEKVKNEEIINYLSNCKYIIQDSFYESCSNVIIEALFSGCIPISSHTEKYNELIKYGTPNNYNLSIDYIEKVKNIYDKDKINFKNTIFYYIDIIENNDFIDDKMIKYIEKLNSNIIIIYSQTKIYIDPEIFSSKIILILEEFLNNNTYNYLIKQIFCNKEYALVTNYKLPYILNKYIGLEKFVYLGLENILIKNFEKVIYQNYICKEFDSNIQILFKTEEFFNIDTIDKYLEYIINNKLLDKIMLVN